MSNWIAIGISTLALLVSGLTAWFTLLHRGDLRMTKPTVVFFRPDGGHHDKPHLKVFLRTLLYSRSRRAPSARVLALVVRPLLTCKTIRAIARVPPACPRILTRSRRSVV